MNSSFSKTDPRGRVLDRWKYSITGLVTLVAILIMTAVIAVQIKNRINKQQFNSSSDGSATRLGCILSEISSNMDPSVDPCDDFYGYACGSFAKKYQLPKGKMEVNYYTLHDEQVYKDITDRLEGDKLLSNGTIGPVKYIKRFWDACISEIPQTGQQMAQLIEYLNQLDKLDSWQDKFTKVTADGYSVLIDVKIDRRSSDNIQVTVGPPQFAIKREYANRDSDLLAHYFAGLSARLNHALTQPEVFRLISFDYFLLQTVKLKAKNGTERNPLTSMMTIEELDKVTSMDWTKTLNQLFPKIKFTASTKVTVEAIQYVKDFQPTIDSMDEKMLSDYLKMSVIQQSCFFMDKECRDEVYKFTQNSPSIFSATPEYKNKSKFVEKVCFDFLVKNLEDLVFSVYTSKDEDEDIEDADKYYTDLIASLVTEFKSTINEITWMDEETKARAKKFVERLSESIEVKSPSYVNIDEEIKQKYIKANFMESNDEMDIFEHFRLIVAHKKAQDFGVREFKTRPTWPISLFSPLPYVNQVTKKLLVPEFFLRGPLTAPNSPAQVRFGFFASLLAHEMTHSFDEISDYYSGISGSKFWSKWTKEHFNKSKKCLIDAYSEEEVEIITLAQEKIKDQLNGSRSVNENLADLIGVNVAYRAYKRINSSHLIDTDDFPEPLKNLTGDQLFFLSFANVHCSNQLQTRIFGVDLEPPRKLMVNLPLAHTTEFAHAFRCKAGSRMNPPKKCPFT